MKKKTAISGILFCVLLLSPVMAQAEDKTESAAAGAVPDFSDQMRIVELERAVGNLDRKISRLEDRYEKLDHDLKELKRKV